MPNFNTKKIKAIKTTQKQYTWVLSNDFKIVVKYDFRFTNKAFHKEIKKFKI